jgi:hypothetical protein
MFLISPFGHLPRPVGNGMSIAEQSLKNVAIGRLGCFVGDDVQDFVYLGRLLMLRLVGCLPRRNGAAARAAGIQQASKEETAEHRAAAAGVMGIVASASGAEPPSQTRSGVGELAAQASASPAGKTIGMAAPRKRTHRGKRQARHGKRRCAGCSGHHQCYDGHERAGGRS